MVMVVVDVVMWSATVLFVSQILVERSLGYPLGLVHDANNAMSEETTRSKRSPAQLICQPKTHVTQTSGLITSPRYKTLPDDGASCTWSIHGSSGQKIQVEFLELNIVDTCPGICECNYVLIKEPSKKAKPVSRKYCNERKHPQVLVTTGERLKIHLRLKAGSSYHDNRFTIRYTTVDYKSSEEEDAMSIVPSSKKTRNHSGDIEIHGPAIEKTLYSRARIDEGSDRVMKIPPTSKHVVSTVKNADEESGPSKLTVLLAVAIPVVMIFILVVLIIAYYNYRIDNKQTRIRREDIQKSGSAIGDMILNSGVTLAPMFNLKKARKESSVRKEKANQLYDDMLQSWKATHANRKERLRAKQESVNVWESFQASRKQRRNTRESQKSNSEAFAMLLSSAINVSASQAVQEMKESVEKDEEEEVTPRASSILINRNSSDDIHHKRSSKVLSWSDISTKSKEEPVSENLAKSAIELKPRGSGNIPAIVVSQPSFETEDEDQEAKDTDRLLKDEKDGAEESDPEKAQPTSSKPTYSCSEHVKDILRESYGEDLEEWWQDPKKTEPQSDDGETKLPEEKDKPATGSLKNLPDSDVNHDDTKLAAVEDDVD